MYSYGQGINKGGQPKRWKEEGQTERQRKTETEIIPSDISSHLLSWKKQRFVGFPYMYLLLSSVSVLNYKWETLLSFERFGLLNLWILPRLHHYLKLNKPIHSENNVWVRSVKIRTKYLSSQILRSLGLSYFCHYSCGFCHSADMNRQAGTPSDRILASATRPFSPFHPQGHHPSSDPYHLVC